jgi:hypothetical protein
MADPFTSVTATSGPFDTAAMQIALAQAQAAADHSNQLAFLREIAAANDDANAHALDSTITVPATDTFLSNGLLNLDPTIDPAADPATLSLFSQFGADSTTEGSIKAQQLHDFAVLQKDAQLLEEAANENTPLPLSSGASTVDLSLQAQSIVAGTNVDLLGALTAAQLAQAAAIIQPIADQTLTPELLQQIQTQLAAAQNPMQASISNLAFIFNYIAAMQPNPTRVMENTLPKANTQLIAPVSAVARVAEEDSAIHG